MQRTYGLDLMLRMPGAEHGERARRPGRVPAWLSGRSRSGAVQRSRDPALAWRTQVAGRFSARHRPTRSSTRFHTAGHPVRARSAASRWSATSSPVANSAVSWMRGAADRVAQPGLRDHGVVELAEDLLERRDLTCGPSRPSSRWQPPRPRRRSGSAWHGSAGRGAARPARRRGTRSPRIGATATGGARDPAAPRARARRGGESTPGLERAATRWSITSR